MYTEFGWTHRAPSNSVLSFFQETKLVDKRQVNKTSTMARNSGNCVRTGQNVVSVVFIDIQL